MKAHKENCEKSTVIAPNIYLTISKFVVNLLITI